MCYIICKRKKTSLPPISPARGKNIFDIWVNCSYCVCQLPLIEDAALLPEDRDVAEERKRVLECQPIVESMVGSPLILQELSKV